jgi:hypothetical protein
VPAGPKIAFSGGDTTDHKLIWAKLDQVHAKHPDMVLMHGGSPKGAEKIAARWADNRKVPQVAFKPDWTKHAKAAPFKRNDQMLGVMPIGVVIFPGTGIQDNRGQGPQARRQGPQDGHPGPALAAAGSLSGTTSCRSAASRSFLGKVPGGASPASSDAEGELLPPGPGPSVLQCSACCPWIRKCGATL